jgi:hypothetical protein
MRIVQFARLHGCVGDHEGHGWLPPKGLPRTLVVRDVIAFLVPQYFFQRISRFFRRKTSKAAAMKIDREDREHFIFKRLPLYSVIGNGILR